MGQPKLLLPWGDATIIESVLSRWRASRVDHVVVVVRPDDVQLAEICRRAGVEVVIPPFDPEQMKTSVQLALAYVERHFQPHDRDAWLLAPADMPDLPVAIVDRLVASYESEASTILVPTRHGRRGHPVLFPWPLSRAVHQLADDQGVNVLLDRYTIREISCDESAIHQDLDTPEDYRLDHPPLDNLE
jgi:molybdenum cofactor cytidylyltransferase